MPLLVEDRDVKAAIRNTLDSTCDCELFQSPANIRSCALVACFEVHLLKPGAVAEMAGLDIFRDGLGDRVTALGAPLFHRLWPQLFCVQRILPLRETYPSR